MKKEFEAPSIQIMFHNVTKGCSKEFRLLADGEITEVWIFAKDSCTYEGPAWAGCFTTPEKMATCYYVTTLPAAWLQPKSCDKKDIEDCNQINNRLHELIDNAHRDMTQLIGGIDMFDYSRALALSIPMPSDDLQFFCDHKATNDKELDKLLKQIACSLRADDTGYLKRLCHEYIEFYPEEFQDDYNVRDNFCF